MTKQYPLVLFMKGTPESPMCGFSRRVVDILVRHNTVINSVDVIANAELREEAKLFSHWPTFPQLYVGGKFVGGCDIVTQLHEGGELGPMLKEAGAVQASEKSAA